MARQLRIEFPGALYHVFSRGVAKQPIFESDEDRARFLDILGKVVERHNWIIHAYCLMGNHYHLLVETPDPNLSRGMQLLNGVYAQRHNAEHGRVGHLFQGRYGNTLVDKEEYFLVAACYIVLNPVRGGLVEHPSAYRWSSYRATAGAEKAPSFLHISSILLCFAPDLHMAQRLYREFVDGGIDEETARRLESGGVCGGEVFQAWVGEIVEGRKRIREIPRRQRYVGRPSLARILDGWADQRERDENIARAVQDFGYTQKEVADHLGLAPSTVSVIMKRVGQGSSGAPGGVRSSSGGVRSSFFDPGSIEQSGQSDLESY
ncbi:MAG: transposase [Actinobacteria bacterium]|nr:transposase [Actinomycetota bacterium]